MLPYRGMNANIGNGAEGLAGSVIRNTKSGKLYGVLSHHNDWLSLKGIRNGKAFGPLRGARFPLAGYEAVPGLRLSGLHASFTVIEEGVPLVTLLNVSCPVNGCGDDLTLTLSKVEPVEIAAIAGRCGHQAHLDVEPLEAAAEREMVASTLAEMEAFTR